MENIVVLLILISIIAAVCAVAGYLFGRSRARTDPQLEAQLDSARDHANRMGVQAA